MAENSAIGWTHHTFNPWWGCTQVSPACDFCYALNFAKRVGFSATGSQFPIWGKDEQRRLFKDAHWDEPLRWDRKAEALGERKRVFCGSMCDVMEDRDDLATHRQRLYSLIQRTPNLDWLLLTKRPQNFRRFLPAAWLETPQPNVWGMTTVESSKYLWRIDALKGCPFVVHGLSIEPLLGDMPTLGEYLDGIGWVIVGGESQSGARPMHPDWARRVRDLCVNLKIPFFFKQWGEFVPCGFSNDSKFFRFTDGQHMERVGTEVAGRLLDGQEWSRFPEVRS